MQILLYNWSKTFFINAKNVFYLHFSVSEDEKMGRNDLENSYDNVDQKMETEWTISKTV